MLLELLSDFQISIPELGRIEARTHPVVLLTSNNTRELTEALEAPLPLPVARLPLERARARDRAAARARAAGDGRAAARRGRPHGARARPQEAALDRRVDRLGARAAAARRRRHRRRRLPRDAVDHRQAPHRPRHRGRARRRAARRGRDSEPPGRGRRVRARSCARRGVAVGTSELLDAFAALGEVSWTEESAFREALAATLAKSPEDRRVFDLVFERFFFRAAEAAAMEQGVREGPRAPARRTRTASPAASRSTTTTCASSSLQAIRDGDESAMRDLARLAIAAFGRRGEGSGVLGVDVQRIRRALGLRSEPGGPVKETDGALPPPALTRDQIRRFEAAPAARARARADRAHAVAAAVAAAERARPRAADRPAAGPRRRAPRRRAAQAPARHPGPRDARAQAPRARRRAPHDARVAADRRRAGRAEVPPAAAAAPGALRAVRRLDLASPARRSSS